MESVLIIFISSALLVNYLSRFHRILAQCWRARQRDVFYKMFVFAFQGHQKQSKGSEQGSDY